MEKLMRSQNLAKKDNFMMDFYAKQKYNFDDTCDSFVGVTSRHLPLHSDFIKFWTMTINVDKTSDNILELEVIGITIEGRTACKHSHTIVNIFSGVKVSSKMLISSRVINEP
jgi:hypothetical protein